MNRTHSMQTTEHPPLLLSPDEVARQLGCGRSHVYVLLGSGELTSVKVGRLRRVPTAAVEAYVARLVSA